MRAVLLAVDEDPRTRGRLDQELRKRYGADYEVISAATTAAGREALDRVEAQDADLAMVFVNLKMWESTGSQFMSVVHRRYPTARRVLTIEWGTRDAFSVLYGAFARQEIDDWIAQPWTAGDEHFHQGVSAFLYDWARRHRPVFEAVHIVGERWSRRSHEIRDLLSRISFLFSFYDVDSGDGQALLKQAGAVDAELPVLVTFEGKVLVNPSNAQILEAFGINVRPQANPYDVAIIGAGPAGLGAAVYGASEGLRAVLLEQLAFGGQAGSSSLIRNYLGFPRGISGTDLAVRAYQQAAMFGAELVHGQVTQLRAAGPSGRLTAVTLANGSEITSRGVIIATGVTYRRLGVPVLERLVGSGVFYGSNTAEAQALRGQLVVVVGGANSAGQAALHLAKYAAEVTMVVRGASLAQSMSDYLIREISAARNISVRYDTEVVDGIADTRLTGVVLKNRTSSTTETVPANALFVLIGAEPHTSWLPDDIQRDRWGYILTGADLPRRDAPAQSPRDRPPLSFETSLPGVFAVGDVRHGSIKRVASAVGEGSVAIRMLHEHLANA